MKKLLFSLMCSLMAIPVSSFAADMPIKAAPLPAAIFDWSGFYAGIQAGGGWGRENWSENSEIITPHFKPDGGIFGGQAGYRWQADRLVLGMEGSAAWANLKGSDSIGGGTPTFDTFKVQALYSVTGQIGLAMDRTLLYAKAGWALASTHYDVSVPSAPATGEHSQDPSGWVIGAGLDYAVWQNVTLGVEYDHYDLDLKSFIAPASNGGAGFSISNPSRLTIDQVVARLNYKY